MRPSYGLLHIGSLTTHCLLQTPGTFNTQPPTFGKAQPRQKKKLSLVDPNTGKAIELGGRGTPEAFFCY